MVRIDLLGWVPRALSAVGAMALVAACGDSFTSSGAGGAGGTGGATSTSSSTSGTGGQSEGGGGGASSSGTGGTTTDAGPPGAEVPCGVETCKNGMACCIWPTDPDKQSFCDSPGQCGGYLEATCNEQADCGNGQVCCMTITGGVNDHKIACVNDCAGELVCTGDASICEDGAECVVAGALPEGYKVCITPTEV
ncbi:MAG: hypothetical protein JRI68_02690 [Deltaproteobacteria bacterium]|nr:hypothetical protein [Deltaproteobacteria bacterium]